MVGVPLAAILFQVYIPRFVPDLAYLELPLLVTVYFSLARRSPVAGVLFGMGIGGDYTAGVINNVGFINIVGYVNSLGHHHFVNEPNAGG